MADNDLVVVTSSGFLIVRIRPDGTVTFGEGYTPDEAAKAFWQSVANARVEDEASRVLAEHTEGLLIKLGEQDLRYEECQRKAQSDEGTHHDAYQAERARGQLEMYVHQLIELARGLVLRNRANQEVDRKEMN